MRENSKFFFFVFVFVLLALPVYRTQGQSPEWKLIWADEFDYTGLPDAKKWSFDQRPNAEHWNGEDQFYTAGRLENARVQDGKLIITARKENADGRKYTSAMLRTKGKGDWLYCKIEVRARLPAGRGIWPAIWMMPSEDYYGPWPASGEIDIMEFFGFMDDYVHHNIHTEAYNHKINTNKGTKFKVNNLQADFHIYSLEWNETGLDFYFDGNKTFSYEKESNSATVWPYNRLFHLILNCAVGGDWCREAAGGVDDTIFPQEFIVDYVRVYTKDTGLPLTLNVEDPTGGFIDKHPDQRTYPAGANVRLTAGADTGYRFAGWTGDFVYPEPVVQLTVTRDTLIRARFVPANELLYNGDFSAGLAGWSAWTDTSIARSDIRIADRSLRADVLKPGKYDWQIQINQRLSLENGKQYQIVLTACAGVKRSLRIGLIRNHEPYTNYFTSVIRLDKKWQTFTLDFTMQKDTDNASRLELDLGSEKGTVYLKNISVRFF